MNGRLCHTCKYEHSQIACSGCEHDNDEYVKADWFTEKEAKIKADERKKCVEELTQALAISPFCDEKVTAVKIWISNQTKGE